MTTIFDVTATCGVCGARSSHSVLGSTNTMGYSDLDTRPAPMQRWTMAQWIQRCPGCGYCAPEIERAPSGARAIVESPAYQAKLKGDGLPAAAVPFVCHAHVCAGLGQRRAAGWGMVHAAWVCDDDADAAEAAVRCREWAIEHLDADREDRPTPEGQPGAPEAVLTDLARRAGHPEQAAAFAQEGLAAGAEGLIRRLLEHQLALIAAGDRACHTLEAVGQEPS